MKEGALKELMEKDCEKCVNWFMGCLHGRKEWKDKADKPNFRLVGLTGREYGENEEEKIPAEEYPLRAYCDSFEYNRNYEDGLFNFGLLATNN